MSESNEESSSRSAEGISKAEQLARRNFEKTEALRARAEAAFRANQIVEAERICQEILLLDPRHVQALHIRRLLAHSIGNIALEMDLLSQILKIDPNHPESLHGLGNALRKQGRVADAIPACLKAIELRPSYAIAYNTLGLCYLETGQTVEAGRSFERAIALQPDLAAAHLNLGSALQRLNRSVEAAKCYRRAASLVPNSAEAHEALGHLYLQQRRRKEAATSFGIVLKMRPQSVEAHLMIAETLAQQGLTNDAIEVAGKALILNPNSGQAHSLLGFAYLDKGDFEHAMTEFKQSISNLPIQADAYLGLVTGHKITEEDCPLVEQMRCLSGDSRLGAPARIQVHAALAKSFDDLGEYERAITYADEGNRIAMSQEGFAARCNDEALESYVDSSIKTFTSAYFKDHAEMGLDSDLPLLIIGLPRSGTTLMEQIVSSHSMVAPGGEIRYWEDVSATTSGGLLSLPSNRSGATSAADAYLRLLTSIGPDARFVADKFNDNVFNLGVIHLMFPKARIIYCRRNPIDNCISLYMTPFRQKPAAFCSRAGILHYYRNGVRLMDHWRKVLPADRLLEVNYEEVVADKETATRRVIEFCGLEWEDSCSRHQDNSRVVITPSKWQARQPIYTTSVERWKRYAPWLGAFRELLPPEYSHE